MLIAVRHGSTKFNENGKEKLRGWLPLPLDEKGMEQACKTAKYLKDLNLVEGPIHTSDLPRAIQTAHEIANETNTEIEPTEHLKDWNTGELTGKDVVETLPTIHQYMDNPQKVIPGGESYETYFNRVYPYIKKLTEDARSHTVVTHNRIMTLIHAMSKSKGEIPRTQDLKVKGPVEPGGIMIVNPDWSTVYTDKIGEKSRD